MAIDATVTRRSNGGWRFTWTPGTSPYSIYLDGELIGTVTDELYDFERFGYADAPPELEILSDGETSEGETYPPYYLLQWRGSTTAAAYLVQQLVSGTWTTRGTVMETGLGYYSWKSTPQADESELQYRVVPLSGGGKEGTPLSFSVTVVRNPAAPDVAFAINSSGDVEVA